MRQRVTAGLTPAAAALRHLELSPSYGIDRPDLRYGLKLHDVSDLAAQTDFGPHIPALIAGIGRIGAGIAGIATAHRLATSYGLGVTLVDPRPPLTLTSDK